MRRFLFLIVFFIFAIHLFADAELDSIRQAIKEKGAKWQAGITSMSILSKEERRARLGYIKGLDPAPHEREMGPVFTPSKTYPESLDWRNYNGVNYITPIRDQGACGSCVCFSVLGPMEAVMNIDAGCENLSTDMSEQELMSCNGGSCSGWNIEPAMNTLKYIGVSEEACFPYQANDNIPCSERCGRYMFTKRKANQWGWAYPYVWGIKDVVQNGPIAVSFTVYEDFNSYTGGVYRHVWGGISGYHAVTLVGWNDADSCWIVKNCWGPNWGEDGYFRIAWGECDIEQGAAWLTMVPAGYPYLIFVSYMVNDSIGGDGDGVLNPGEQGKIIVTIENVQGWDDAQFVDAVLRCNDPRISIIDSTGDYGTIVDGQSKDNASDPFEVLGVEGGSLDPVAMTLYVTAVGSSGSYWIELEFDMEFGWMQSGWPVQSEQVKTSPAVVDLNNDYIGEVIYGSEGGNLFVKNYRGEDFSTFPYHVSNKLWASPAVGDVDNDGVIDIAFAGFNNNIYLVDRLGNLSWSVTTGGPVIATPALSDLDNDNKLEIIVGSFDKKLYVLKSDGTPFNTNFPLSLPDASMITAGCAVGDINGDYTKEIIVATYGGNVYAVSPDGTILTGWPFHTGGNIWDAPSIANLDGTGVKITIGSTNDTLYVINSDGTLDWKVGTGGDVRSSPSFANVDGDNDLEIFFGSDDCFVYAYHHTGAPLAGWPIDLGSKVRSQVVFSDLNNDNAPEVIVIADGGELFVFEGNGDTFDIFPLPTAGSPTTPAVEDIDNDGDLEIFFGNINGLSAIDYKEARGYEAYWNMFRCNPKRTGNIEDAAVRIEESKDIEPTIFKIYPNPFKSSTGIFFSAVKNQKVDISIYNIVGQRVRRIESKGEKTYRIVNWDGRNNENKPVPAGVYFCVARTGRGLEIVKKLIKIE
ncbi:MAG: T9SS type A sorting domain-containing protein [Candidatus Cloacimonadota bacterium]|nr:MAG: T9SS type A sorting domain-containing protein [Candidatus Cloacimonadota bacterium]